MPISSSLPRNSRTYAILYTINEIRPYLYICGYGAVNEQKLKELGITHIVDCTNIPSRRRIPGIEYFHVCVEDSEAANIVQYFEAATTFIKKAKDKGGKILVYCAAGISRSSTICIVYLMIHEGLTLREAYYDVERARSLISPNSGFWRQMIEYERKRNGGKSTVAMIQSFFRAVPDVYVNKVVGPAQVAA